MTDKNKNDLDYIDTDCNHKNLGNGNTSNADSNNNDNNHTAHRNKKIDHGRRSSSGSRSSRSSGTHQSIVESWNNVNVHI